MGYLLGYARVSTDEQNPDLQLDALQDAGCYRTFVDRASGALAERPELTKLLDQLRPDDTLVVWRLDRLGRSVSHLVGVVNDLRERGVGFRSLTEGIDTTTAGGKLIFSASDCVGRILSCVIASRISAWPTSGSRCSCTRRRRCTSSRAS